MVLRAAEAATRMLRVHTDVRGAKLAHWAREPEASVLFYDAAAKLQLRAAANVAVHSGDAIAAAGWAASAPQSRLCYEQAVAPGAVIVEPLPELPVDARFAEGDDGAANFAVAILTVREIEWLYLAIEGHRRARWRFDGGRWNGHWLAP
jgi:hypothetical protein